MMIKAREEKFAQKHAAATETDTGKKIRWRVGESVTVIKKGSQTGKKGVVENPMWNGRVKVKMDDTSAVKSYKSSEIR